MIDGTRTDGGQEPSADGRGKESGASEIVGDPRKGAARGGWIKIAGVIRGENKWAGGKRASPAGAEGVKDFKKGKTEKPDKVEPDGANLHGTVGLGF